MRHPDRRSPRAKPTAKRARNAYRPSVESLEDRTLLAAPVIDPLQVPLNLPVGKSLIVPVSASSSSGGAVSYSVTTNDPHIVVVPHTGDTFLQLNVAGFGSMEFELFGDLTPNTVNYISGLVQSEFYNGLTFHRVIKNFVIQGGDPNGDGSGGPPGPGASQTQLQQLQFDDAFNTQTIFDGVGQLAMAKAGNDTNGSQFFITDGQPRNLDFLHTIFGQMVRGFDVLNAIQNVPVTAQSPTNTEVSRPITPVVITSAQIIQDPTAQVFTLTSLDTSPTPFTLTITATGADGSQSTQTDSGQVITDTANPSNEPPFLSTITVNGAPITDATGFRISQNGTTAAGTPATVSLSAIDVENDTPTFSLTETHATAEAVITPVAGSNGQFTVTPNAGFTGLLHLHATVTETGATRAPDSEDFTIAVGDMALTPGTAGATVSATEGSNAGGVSLGTFADADLTSQASDFSVAINWGDGTALDTTTGHVTGQSGSFSVTGSHTYAESGKYVAKVTITDIHQGTGTNADVGGTQATLTANATVTEAPVTAQGAPVADTVLGIPESNVVVATFSDADPNGKAGDYSATIDWGDGTTSPGTVTAAGNGQFNVLGSHSYQAAGTFSVGVSVTDTVTSGFVPSVSTSSRTAATVITLDQRFVTQAFVDMTGAPPTPAQRATYEALLARLGRTGLALQIEKLPAYTVHQVVLTYLHVFGGLPNARQVRDGVKFLAHHGTVQALAQKLYASDIYFRAVGHRSNSRFLLAAAQGVLGSSINTVNLQLLLAELNAGLTRGAAIADLESVSGALFQQAQNLDLDFLHRPGTAAEVQAQATMLGAGVPVNALIAELVGSDTYLRHLLFGT